MVVEVDLDVVVVDFVEVDVVVVVVVVVDVEVVEVPSLMVVEGPRLVVVVVGGGVLPPEQLKTGGPADIHRVSGSLSMAQE